ncbi:FAD/NAD(P)-binding domain-containing protein [Mycena indigotica]|uniref:FAD/NAD(P)-binding domain-containing protein n=1 Tax=Mycena indigotica TaxID=2126181 RepID=A0A8H6S2T2_9AGAR|nr:FAD/NAD(P)-binding domain-containing protein [Mycena indigotica]KAF7290802.1 FAD/NAD(P)-binding domain-containing protein [Mycena indigotica]
MAKVIIVGCGIAGPVLALLLKQKGFDPVVYERGPRAPDAGLSLMLQSNGLKVLDLIPGLVDRLPGRAIEQTRLFSILPSDLRLLAQSESVTEKGKVSKMGVNRPKLLALLSDVLEEHGIPVHFDTAVIDVELSLADDVVVHLSNGTIDSAPLVIGCDGLHSAVRKSLFGEQKPVFTGLTQTGGVTTNAFPGIPPTMHNFYGDNLHVIAYPISDSGDYSWAITERGPEAKETWRAMDQEAQNAFKTGPFSSLPLGVGQLLEKAQKITKYGLYDRPALSSWHQGRVLLIGDAAHPTSPHLGQGANQAFEDVSLLSNLLDASDLSLATLSSAFSSFEAERMTRTAELVNAAREAGELRVVAGEEAARQRNEKISASRREWGGIPAA